MWVCATRGPGVPRGCDSRNKNDRGWRARLAASFGPESGRVGLKSAALLEKRRVVIEMAARDATPANKAIALEQQPRIHLLTAVACSQTRTT